MPCRLIFRCRFCDSQPDQLTQISIERQLLHFRFGEWVDCGPSGWLIWHGRGPYGPTQYACQNHRPELRSYVIKHYDGPHARSRKIYPSLPPPDLDIARRRARYQGWASPRPRAGQPQS